jgi:hypothetical protein
MMRETMRVRLAEFTWPKVSFCRADQRAFVVTDHRCRRQTDDHVITGVVGRNPADHRGDRPVVIVAVCCSQVWRRRGSDLRGTRHPVQTRLSPR